MCLAVVTEVTAARRVAGQQRLLPWGSFPYDVQARAIVVLVYLANTIRSQGFAPSQRFNPARALWLYFMPHPPIGL